MDKLSNIAPLTESRRLCELAKKTGKYSFSNEPMTSLDIITLTDINDQLYLYEEPEFLNEMVLAYMSTTFKEYLKSVLKKIFFICPKLKTNPNQEIPEKFNMILKQFKNNLNYNLEEELSDWHLIKKIRARRTLLEHHTGIPNKNYCKTNLTVGKERITTDVEYIKNSIKILIKNQRKINSDLYEKYVYEKFIDQMRLEDNIV